MNFIWSMGRPKKDLESHLRSLESVRIDHLLKVYFWREAKNEKREWIITIKNSPSEAPLRGGGLVSRKWLVKTLWSDVPKHLSRDFQDKIQDTEDTLVDYSERHIHEGDYEKFLGFCEEYHKWLIDILVVGRSTTFSGALNEIDRLLKKYFR